MLDDPLFLVAINLFVAVFIRLVFPNALSALLLAVVLVASTGYLGSKHGSEVLLGAYQARDRLLEWTGHPPAWPPEKFRQYPDLRLVDQNGRRTRLSEFRGKVILLQHVAVTSRACIAFSGGHQVGGFDGVLPQANLERIEVYARQYGGVTLDEDDLVYVQLLLFDSRLQAPAAEVARRWAEHFGFRRDQRRIVLAGTSELATSASREMVPGFHLIDRDFVLRANATGEQPEDSLYTDLLPMVRVLLAE